MALSLLGLAAISGYAAPAAMAIPETKVQSAEPLRRDAMDGSRRDGSRWAEGDRSGGGDEDGSRRGEKDGSRRDK